MAEQKWMVKYKMPLHIIFFSSHLPKKMARYALSHKAIKSGVSGGQKSIVNKVTPTRTESRYHWPRLSGPAAEPRFRAQWERQMGTDPCRHPGETRLHEVRASRAG